MNRFLITSVVTSIVLLGSFAAQAGEFGETYELGGVSEKQFQKDVAECKDAPINNQDIALYVIAPTALLPYYRSHFCMGKKGYHQTTKAAPGTMGHCLDNGGQWDVGTRSCDMPTTETARANVDPAEEAKLGATTLAQCQKLGGAWEVGVRSCY